MNPIHVLRRYWRIRRDECEGTIVLYLMYLAMLAYFTFQRDAKGMVIFATLIVGTVSHKILMIWITARRMKEIEDILADPSEQ